MYLGRYCSICFKKCQGALWTVNFLYGNLMLCFKNTLLKMSTLEYFFMKFLCIREYFRLTNTMKKTTSYFIYWAYISVYSTVSFQTQMSTQLNSVQKPLAKIKFSSSVRLQNSESVSWTTAIIFLVLNTSMWNSLFCLIILTWWQGTADLR